MRSEPCHSYCYCLMLVPLLSSNLDVSLLLLLLHHMFLLLLFNVGIFAMHVATIAANVALTFLTSAAEARISIEDLCIFTFFATQKFCTK